MNAVDIRKRVVQMDMGYKCRIRTRTFSCLNGLSFDISSRSSPVLRSYRSSYTVCAETQREVPTSGFLVNFNLFDCTADVPFDDETRNFMSIFVHARLNINGIFLSLIFSTFLPSEMFVRKGWKDNAMVWSNFFYIFFHFSGFKLFSCWINQTYGHDNYMSIT